MIGPTVSLPTKPEGGGPRAVRTMAHKMSAATSKGTRSQRRCQTAWVRFANVRQRPAGLTNPLVHKGEVAEGEGFEPPVAWRPLRSTSWDR
jgi:hypothetical protein